MLLIIPFYAFLNASPVPSTEMLIGGTIGAITGVIYGVSRSIRRNNVCERDGSTYDRCSQYFDCRWSSKSGLFGLGGGECKNEESFDAQKLKGTYVRFKL